VFKVDPSGKETVPHNFRCRIMTPDGSYPGDGLLLDEAGNLYGTTAYGGIICDCGTPVWSHNWGGPSGAGEVYKLSKTGTFTVLRSFAQGTMDGCGPEGILSITRPNRTHI